MLKNGDFERAALRLRLELREPTSRYRQSHAENDFFCAATGPQPARTRFG